MKTFNTLIEKRLRSTCLSFLKHSIEHIVLTDTSYDNSLQILVNIQSSFELLLKLIVFKKKGWKSIVQTKHHSCTEKSLLNDLKNGNLKTFGFDDIAKEITNSEEITPEDGELIKRFQLLRNQTVHLGFESLPKEIFYESIYLLSRVFNFLEYQESLSTTTVPISNFLEELLGHDLYRKFLDNTSIIADTTDRAFELFEKVNFCLWCGQETLAHDELKGEWTCLLCGCRIPENAFEYIKCPVCNYNSLMFDVLNIKNNKYIEGLCCHCQERINVTYNKEDDVYLPYDRCYKSET